MVLSDRGSNERMAPVPSLLAMGAVHHHLMRNGTPHEARHHPGSRGCARGSSLQLAARVTARGAINPYLALESVNQMVRDGTFPSIKDPEQAQAKYIKSVNKGLLKVMSKMGISTLQSYQGAQIFEAIGLSPEVIDTYFTGTSSRISGIDIDVLADECRLRHERSYPKVTDASPMLRHRRQLRVTAPRCERHLWNPGTVAALAARRPLGRPEELQRVLGADQLADLDLRTHHAARHVGSGGRAQADSARRGGSGQ